MKINRKLYGSLTIILFFLTISFLLFLIMTKPINQMKSEKEILISLQGNLNDELISLGQFMFVKFDSIAKDYNLVAKNTGIGFASLSEIEVLIVKSETIKESINLISDIQNLMIIKREALNRSITIVQNNSQGLTTTNSIMVISNIYKNYAKNEQENSVFNTNSYTLINNIKSMYNALLTSKNIINEQYLLIDKEIEKIMLSSQRVAITLGFIMTIIGIILSVIVTQKIINNIKNIDINTEYLESMDLTNRYNINSHDELGKLANTLNTFLKSLSFSIKEIQTTSDNNIKIKDNMMNSFDKSLDSIGNINSNIIEMSQHTGNLNNSVKTSEESIADILSFIDKLQIMISDELTMVDESSVAINQITSTVNSISDTVSENQNTADRLVTLSNIGEQNLNNTSTSIKDIIDSISQIKGMSDLIEDISSQTNLLSMNAAIEAAHAGEAGKGFSVVADEIRKLAEASSNNSKIITVNIKKVIDHIENADKYNQDTTTSFKDIRQFIENVSNNNSSVLNSMNELGNSGDLVKNTMVNLQNLTSDLKFTSDNMTLSTKSVNESLNVLKQITNKVHDGNENIKTDMDMIKTQVKSVSDLGIEMSNVSQTLDNELNKFKTS
ncbi:MAG: methyl-accepting chemotaxis protein [Spirochaetaceae bacterium]